MLKRRETVVARVVDFERILSEMPQRDWGMPDGQQDDTGGAQASALRSTRYTRDVTSDRDLTG